MSTSTLSSPSPSPGLASDFVLRLAYFIAAPVLIAALARMYPIIGILVNVGIALFVFTFAELVRTWIARYPWLARVFGRALLFEAYYRENAPRPFLYYVFYPLLLPHLLWNVRSRREFALFRGFGAFGLFVLIASAGWDYWAHWQPELPFDEFAKTWVQVVLVQTVVTIMFVMPLATSVVALQREGAHRRLLALLAVAVLVVGVTIGYWAKKRHEYVQIPTADRMMLRTRLQSKKAHAALADAVKIAAFDMNKHNDGEAFKEGRGEQEILGTPIGEARAVLSRFYREDETMAFHLVSMATKKGTLLILYGMPAHKKQTPVWVGLAKGNKLVTEIAELPKDAFALMKRAAQH